MKIALTGATGFLGGHVLRRALEAGHNVHALARKPQPVRDGVQWVAGSLDNAPSLATLCEDTDTVIASVKKTGRCVVVHEAPRTGGFGAEIAALVQQQCFYSLEAPIERVAHFEPTPVARPVVVQVPEPTPEAEPRKWQPPAPTVNAEPAERKGGWWSKRK